jgi:hypothetical protein
MTAVHFSKIAQTRPPPTIAGTPVRISIPNRHAHFMLSPPEIEIVSL